MAIANDIPLALANRFTVKVDAPGEIDLGSWAKVDGLDVTFDVVEYRAGDAWNSRWYCPGATKYSTVKLSRAVTADTEKVKKWLSDTAKNHKPGLMVIELKDSADKKVFTWEMRSAMPSKWSVGGFDAGTSKIATEQLEVVHLGFLDDDTSKHGLRVHQVRVIGAPDEATLRRAIERRRIKRIRTAVGDCSSRMAISSVLSPNK